MINSKSKLLDMEHGEEVAKQLNQASMDCLPDDLLVQILSFLPTKQAVSTSVLSKRWRTLFSLRDNLDFDDPVSDHKWDYWKERDIINRFRDFVYRTLASLASNHIKKFSLKFRTAYRDEGDVARWICNALEYGVSHLHLHIKPERVLFPPFPSKVFTSTTLVNLSLGTKLYCRLSPHDASLPALKVLFLDTLYFKDNQLSDVFLSACPALEDLTIQNMFYPYFISSKTIKRLSVTTAPNYYDDCSSNLTLDIPSVVTLYYSDFSRRKALHCNLDSLAKATLDFRLEVDNHQVQNDADVKDIISEIRNVKALHLTSSAVEVISVWYKGGLPLFNNLVCLMFSSKKRDWKVLPLLLERSPNLKILVLSGLHRYTFGRRHRFVGIRIPPDNQIKMLSIKQYQGSENELKHISHCLLKMECLEVVKVYVAAEIDDLKKMQLTENLLKLPAASSELKLQVM